MNKQRLLILGWIVLSLIIMNRESINYYLVSNKEFKIRKEYIHLKNPNLTEFNIDTLSNNELPKTKEDSPLKTKLVIKSNNKEVELFATIKVQGSSTARWDKKNWTLNLYKDELYDEEIKLKVGDSIISDKWILKAEWIDPTMVRNIISYNLWNDIINARDDNFLEVNESNIQNKGAVGHPKVDPSILNINNNHYGLMTLTLGHDPDNFNIDYNNRKHMYFEFDGRKGNVRPKTWKKFNKEGIGLHIEGYYPNEKDYTKEQIKAIDKFGEFINSDYKSFKKHFDNHLDKRNIIDMLLYIEFLFDWDGVAQDLEIITYDLNKFYFLPWDKDTTFGLNYNETGLFEDIDQKLVLSYDIDVNDIDKEYVYDEYSELEDTESFILWYKTYHAHKKEVEKRYKDLRNKDIFSVNNIRKLANEVYVHYTEDRFELEHNTWPQKPSIDELDLDQIITWTEARLKMLDKHFNYK